MESILVFSNKESLDIGENKIIYSMQFYKPNFFEELLIVSGNPLLGCQIYKIEKKNQNNSVKLIMKQALKFEDDFLDNYILVRGGYFFTKGYKSL